MDNDTQSGFTPVHSLGYTEFLRRLRRRSGVKKKELPDDGALRTDRILGETVKEKDLIFASSIFLDSVHFDLSYTPLEHLGRKLLTAVVSRICARNADPLLSTISLAIPNKLSVEMVEKIYDGFEESTSKYGSALRTGDVTATRENAVITIHVIGSRINDKAIQRRICSPGDQICVTGDLGGAMAGLRVLLREKQAWKESGEEAFYPDLEGYSYVVGRQLLPIARTDFVKALSKAGIQPTSMVDISYGLMNELQQLLEQQEVGARIHVPAVPISLETRSVADEMKEDVDRYACYGGEDYEILFTLPDPDVERLRANFEDFTVIGEILEQKEGIVLNTGEENG